MTLFKKFTDFCAGIAAFVGGLFLLQKYMTFNPLSLDEYIEWLSYEIQYSSSELAEINIEEITEAPSKLSQFLTPDLINGYDYRLMLILVITLVISVLIGRIFKRLPYVCFLFSLFPAIEIAYMLTNNVLYTQKGLFFALAALHILGNIAECAMRDRDDGRHRLFVAAKLSSLFPAALCLICTKLADKVPIEGINERIPIFKDLAFKLTKPENMELVTKLGWIFLIVFAIGLLLYNVYFVDAIISAVPLVYSIYLLYAETLTFMPAIFALLSAICFITNVSLFVLECNSSRKEQLKQREEREQAEMNLSTEEQ